MTELRRQIIKAILFPIVAGIMAGGTYHALDALDASRRTLSAEHAANAEQHAASKKDRALLHDQIEASRETIAALLAEIKRKDAAIDARGKDR